MDFCFYVYNLTPSFQFNLIYGYLFCRFKLLASRNDAPQSSNIPSLHPDMAPSLTEKLFNQYDWVGINITTLYGDDDLYDGGDDDIDGLVVELTNVTSILNDTFHKKIYHSRGSHFLWEYSLVIFIIALVIVSLIINFICGCVNCGLKRGNAILEFQLRYRRGR